MEQTIYAVCPKCAKRAKILGYRWDWDAQQDFAKVKCMCGTHEVPFDENRVVEINLNNPYMELTRFRLRIPVNMNNETWNRVGGCLMRSWTDGTV